MLKVHVEGTQCSVWTESVRLWNNLIRNSLLEYSTNQHTENPTLHPSVLTKPLIIS